MTDHAEIPEDETPSDEATEAPAPGRVIASYMGRITLRDPNPDDVSRAGRPIEPARPLVKDVEAAVVSALEALGYAVGIDLTDTTN